MNPRTNEATAMQTNTELLDPLEALEPSRGQLTHRERPIVFPRPGPAANDVDAANLALDAIARSKPGAWELHQAARAWRSYALGEILAAMAMAVAALIREAYAAHVRRREAKAIRTALGELDDRMLRDLGLDRSEIGSVAAEMTGDAERTRMLSALTRNGFLI